MTAEEAVAQILLECRTGCRTLAPAIEIVTGLYDKGYEIVPRDHETEWERLAQSESTRNENLRAALIGLRERINEVLENTHD